MVIRARAKSGFWQSPTIFSSAARVRVPKMVKNGIYSFSEVGGSFDRMSVLRARSGANLVFLAIRRHDQD